MNEVRINGYTLTWSNESPHLVTILKSSMNKPISVDISYYRNQDTPDEIIEDAMKEFEERVQIKELLHLIEKEPENQIFDVLFSLYNNGPSIINEKKLYKFELKQILENNNVFFNGITGIGSDPEDYTDCIGIGNGTKDGTGLPLILSSNLKKGVGEDDEARGFYICSPLNLVRKFNDYG